MSADTLRRAASLMRERAEAVTSEHQIEQTLARGVVRCSCGESSVGDPYWARAHLNGLSWSVSRDHQTQVWDERERVVASAEGLDEAVHIASWHPAVALAVADWLDGVALFVEAKDDEEYFDLDGDPIAAEDTHSIGSALTVARAYLGGRP